MRIDPSRWLPVLLALLLGACASVAPDRADEQGADETEAEEVVRRGSRPARVRVHGAYEFTVRESARIPAGVRGAYNDALRVLEAGNLAEGTRLLEAVVKSAPQLTAPRIDLGVAYALQRNFAAAEKSLENALILTPRHPVAANELGLVYRHTGRFSLARRQFEAALDAFPNYHVAQRNLGVLCDLFLNDLACAARQYQAYQQAYPDDRRVAIWLADVRNRMPVQEGE